MASSRLLLLAAIGGLTASSGAWAAAGGPLPRCDKSTASFYLMRYVEATAANTAPKTVLSQATVPASGAVALATIWDGATAPTPSPRDLSSASGATVAGGMGNDGYIYAMRAVGTQEPGWDLQGRPWADPNGEWRTHTRHYEMLRYGRDGVDNLGIVTGLGTFRTVATDPATQTNGAVDQRLGPNFNAADVDPKTGIFYLANFQSGGALNKVHRIDVTTTPPQYIDTLTLSGNIPGAQSGDFAIDANGEWAYGVATASSILSQAYRFNLSTGAVESLGSQFISGPFGGGARLLHDDTKMAFYGTSTRIMTIPAGTLGSNQTTATANSADAAACLPKLEVTLACTPAELFDSPANAATCTLTLDAPAPVGGLAIALDAIAADPRYGTTCTSPQTIAEGETSTTCTVTATPNTDVGDGDVPVTVALSAPGAQDDYVLGTPSSAELLVRDDDAAVPPGPGTEPTPVPVDAPWMLGLLGALLAGSGALRRRVRHNQR